MAKIGKIKLIGSVGVYPHDPAHRIHKRGFAIRREPHNLVLITIMRKAQILCKGLIENAERVWKVYPPIDGDVVTLPDTPGCAREIAEAIDRNGNRFLKG